MTPTPFLFAKLTEHHQGSDVRIISRSLHNEWAEDSSTFYCHNEVLQRSCLGFFKGRKHFQEVSCSATGRDIELPFSWKVVNELLRHIYCGSWYIFANFERHFVEFVQLLAFCGASKAFLLEDVGLTYWLNQQSPKFFIPILLLVLSGELRLGTEVLLGLLVILLQRYPVMDDEEQLLELCGLVWRQEEYDPAELPHVALWQWVTKGAVPSAVPGAVHGSPAVVDEEESTSLDGLTSVVALRQAVCPALLSAEALWSSAAGSLPNIGAGSNGQVIQDIGPVPRRRRKHMAADGAGAASSGDHELAATTEASDVPPEHWATTAFAAVSSASSAEAA